HAEPQARPFGFQFDQQTINRPYRYDFFSHLNVYWARPDMGFNEIMGLATKDGTDNPKTAEAFDRLRTAMDRHTFWEWSGFKGMGRETTGGYSPFVASSYEMGKSDMFTAPGVT